MNNTCYFQVYDDNDNLKINDMVEVIGFLSVHPALSGEFQPEKNSFLEPTCETDAEILTHNPPPSLVPRLHAVYVKKLDHCNPLIQSQINQGKSIRNVINYIIVPSQQIKCETKTSHRHIT